MLKNDKSSCCVLARLVGGTKIVSVYLFARLPACRSVTLWCSFCLYGLPIVARLSPACNTHCCDIQELWRGGGGGVVEVVVVMLCSEALG